MSADVCGQPRGGARSTTRCELPAGHKDRWHYGRSGSGRWFSWLVRPLERAS